MGQCDWCHEDVPAEIDRWITRQLASLGQPRHDYVATTWGQVPTLLCAHEFNLMVAQVNEACFVASD